MKRLLFIMILVGLLAAPAWAAEYLIGYNQATGRIVEICRGPSQEVVDSWVKRGLAVAQGTSAVSPRTHKIVDGAPVSLDEYESYEQWLKEEIKRLRLEAVINSMLRLQGLKAMASDATHPVDVAAEISAERARYEALQGELKAVEK